MFNKMNGRNSVAKKLPAGYTPANTIIGADTVINSGEFISSGTVSLYGKMQCTVSVTGLIRIEDGGLVEGNIYATAVVIAGRVLGDVKTTHCTITETGEIIGNVTCSKLSVQEGGVINGMCEMQKDLEFPSDIFDEKQNEAEFDPLEEKDIDSCVIARERNTAATA